MRAGRKTGDDGVRNMLTQSIGRRQAGVTLVELMVGMVVGLIVLGAAITLVVSLMKSNNDSIRSMRLSQEMRALADVATMEIRRARGLADPLANVGQGGTAFLTCNAISPGDSGKCLTFGYGCNPSDGTGNFRAIRQVDTNLIIATGAAQQACDAAGTRLNSGDMVLDSVNFSTTAEGAIRMSIEAHLSSDTGMKRTLTRVIWPRSAPVAP